MKITFLIFLLITYLNATDSLIRALSEGTFNYDKTTTISEEEQSETTSSLEFNYTSATFHGGRLEVKNDGFEAFINVYYNNSLYDFDYTLNASNHIDHSRAYSLDVNYMLRRELSLGSRFSVENDSNTITSYAGVYSTIVLDSISKGLNVGISYDTTTTSKGNEKFGITINSEF